MARCSTSSRPSLVDDESFKAWWARALRSAACPAGAAAIMQDGRRHDARHVLPSIHVPTLVIHRTTTCSCRF